MDQSETIAFLIATLQREIGEKIDRIDTHVSLVFLSGERVFKLKRSVAFPYLDFSTPEKREVACRAELALNSRTAPGLYLGVRRITSEPEGLAFDGPGQLVDCIVVMRRFEEKSLFDAMAREHRLTAGHIEALAAALANFHAMAERFPKAPNREGAGGAPAMAHLLDLNEISFAHSPLFEAEKVERLNKAFRETLAAQAELLDLRAAAGFVRLCHGDLYLRNICLFEGRPTPFDCIEFDMNLAHIDVLYDIAFTLMDLWLLGRRDFANLLFNRYASAFGRTLPVMPANVRDGYALLPFFMALRAAIRAHIAASQARSGHGEAQHVHEAEALAYFDLAADLLKPRPIMLVAIGGLSGSGKSTLAGKIAAEIGPPPGARTLNSDRTRKAMHRLRPNDRLPPEAYALNITVAVYLRLLSRSMDALAQGRAAIVDAVYSTEGERAAVAKLAHEKNVAFVGIWLEADPEILRQRVRDRPVGVSDANESVLEAQLARDNGRIDWTQLNSASPELVAQALEIVASELARSQKPLESPAI